MASSFHDGNHTPTLLGVGTDGKSIVNATADETSHRLQVSVGSTGTDNGPSVSLHDDNHIAVLIATSNADGKTPVPVYVDSNGYLLIDEV